MSIACTVRRFCAPLALAPAAASLLLLCATGRAVAADAPVMSPADTAWVMTSSALVMLMLPGLALFYGGMVQRKNVLNSLCTPSWPSGSSAFNGP